MGIRVRYGKQIAIKANFCIDRCLCIRPMDGTLYLAAVRCIAPARLRVVFRIYLDYIAILILLTTGTTYHIGGLQPHLIAGKQAEISLHRFFHEVLLFNPQFAREGNCPCSVLRLSRIVLHLKGLCLPLGIIC